MRAWFYSVLTLELAVVCDVTPDEHGPAGSVLGLQLIGRVLPPVCDVCYHHLQLYTAAVIHSLGHIGYSHDLVYCWVKLAQMSDFGQI